MEKNKDLEISLLDAPVGAVVDLVSWGSLSQEVVAISNVHVAIGRPVAKELKVLWNKEVDE